MGREAPRFEAVDAALLVVLPSTPEQAGRIAKLIRAPFPVLADPRRIAFRAFRLGRKLLLMQQSGAALVNRAGRIVYARRSTVPRGALDVDELLRAAETAHVREGELA